MILRETEPDNKHKDYYEYKTTKRIENKELKRNCIILHKNLVKKKKHEAYDQIRVACCVCFIFFFSVEMFI